MFIARLIVMMGLLVASLAAQQSLYFIPTSEVVRVASMAARNEGYDPYSSGMYLDELRTKDGKEPIPGYASIALYKNARIMRSYSIRVETGDVVDATACKLFRYADLLRFKKDLLKGFGTKEVSDKQIAAEVGCDKLDVLPAKSPERKQKQKTNLRISQRRRTSAA